jgi:hypothetical protein
MNRLEELSNLDQRWGKCTMFRIFGAKHTFEKVANELIAGLKDGTITLAADTGRDTDDHQYFTPSTEQQSKPDRTETQQHTP